MLRAQVIVKATVLRDGQPQSIPAEEVVPGDVVLLSAGSLIPADGLLLEARDFFVHEAVLTGETFPAEKKPGDVPAQASLAQRTNAVFMGTNVRSGSGRALIEKTGAATAFGQFAGRLALRPPETEFVRGDSVMKGYLNKPQETARALQEGWFRTGDMGYKTESNDIILVGCIKDVINVAGIKVAPFEIEAALNDHPNVSESAAVGVEDDMYGEVVKAFVKPRQGASPDERELVRFLQRRLMSFQVPKAIVFVDEFPRNNMGKIDKKALRAI